MSDRTTAEARLRIRLVFGDKTMLGPGKADLLEAIHETGSIAAAGRSMKMSYKRAWTLVETMNAMFEAPLVESSRGGERGGKAALTATGAAVLDHYRRLEAAAEAAGSEAIDALQALRSDMSDGK